MRIYLIGYMASGKSSLGRELADMLGWPLADLDQWFEERYRISVADFFEKYDEQAFRSIERTLLRDTLRLGDAVIATGGGTPCFFDNMEFIRKSGVSVYLRWDAPALADRLGRLRRKRPLLKEIAAGALEAKIRADLAVREVFYGQADAVAEGNGLTAAALYEMVIGCMAVKKFEG